MAGCDVVQCRTDLRCARQEEACPASDVGGLAFVKVLRHETFTERMPLDSRERNQLAKLLGMLGSAHPGEVLNAAQFANKLVGGRGLDWHQVLDNGISPPADLERRLREAREKSAWGVVRGCSSSASCFCVGAPSASPFDTYSPWPLPPSPRGKNLLRCALRSGREREARSSELAGSSGAGQQGGCELILQ